MFVKRAGRFLHELLKGLNDATFTPISEIAAPEVANEEAVNVASAVKIMATMGYIEVLTNEDGSQSLRLTPDGVLHLNTFNSIGAR